MLIYRKSVKVWSKLHFFTACLGWVHVSQMPNVKVAQIAAGHLHLTHYGVSPARDVHSGSLLTPCLVEWFGKHIKLPHISKVKV